MKDNSMPNGYNPLSGQGQIDNSGNDNMRGAASQAGVSGKAIIEENFNFKNVGGSEGSTGGGTGGSEADHGNNGLVGTSGGEEGTQGDLSGGAGGGTGISVEDDDDTSMGTNGAGDNSATHGTDD